MAKTKTYTVAPATQKTFIALVVVSTLLQLFTICYWIVRQYPSNHNLSSYLWLSVEGVAAPLIFFLTAYLLRHRGDGLRAHAFDSAFFAAMGMLGAGVLSQLGLFITISRYDDSLINSYWTSQLFALAPFVLAYIVYLIVLLRYR